MRRALRIAACCILSVLTLATAAVWVTDVYLEPLGWESNYEHEYALHVLCHHNLLNIDFFINARPHQRTTPDGWWIEGGGFTLAYFGTYCPPDAIPRRPPRYRLAAPFWFLLLLFSAYPLVVLARRAFRHRRLRPGHCLNCGYNLTGNVSGVCSECGAEIQR